MDAPLKSVVFKGDITENEGTFEVFQEYISDNKTLTDIEYTFSLSPTSTVTSVQMKTGDTILSSTLFNNEIAEYRYKKGLENKHKCILLRQNNNKYTMNIGNVSSGEKIEIKYVYFDTIPYTNGSYELIIPVSQYRSDRKDDILLDIEIKWLSSNKITKFVSLTHNDDFVIEVNDTFCRGFLKTTDLSHDVNLICTTQHDVDYFTYCDEKYIYNTYYIKMPDTTHGCRHYKYTNLFLVDCSTSMEGYKMDKTKEALRLFINSLDIKTKYNIIQFGSTYHKMYSEDVEYTESNVKDTIKKINRIDADYGETKLLRPINYILDHYGDSFTNVFILTDGKVEDKKDVINSINKKRKKLLRFFTIGFGTDSDRDFCENVAKAGAGMYNMADVSLNKTLINQYVISKKDYYYNIDLDVDIDTAVIKDCNYGLPDTIFKIYTRTPISKFTKKTKLYYVSSDTKILHEHEFTSYEQKMSDIAKKVFVREWINYITNNMTSVHEIEELVQISIENNILCPFTSFVLVDNSKQVDMQSIVNTINTPMIHKKAFLFSSEKESIKKVGIFSNLYNSFVNYFASDDEKIPKNISDYQNFDGSFKYVPEVLKFMGLDKNDIERQTSIRNCSIEKCFHICVKEYLEKHDEYVCILDKLNEYILHLV